MKLLKKKREVILLLLLRLLISYIEYIIIAMIIYLKGIIFIVNYPEYRLVLIK